AAARMMESEDVGSIPVVTDQESGSLVGIITDRDIAIQVAARGREARTTRVEDVMTRQPVTCEPGDPVEKALERMREHQVRRIPVVENGAITGIIAQADIAVRLDQNEETAELVEEISR
ncbi:MAG: CBS domain-containing protein, partial [Gemmatimonadales bacterium]